MSNQYKEGSYNNTFFDQDTNGINFKGLKKVYIKNSWLIDFLAKFLQATADQPQIKNCYSFIRLALKIKSNLEATNHLLKLLIGDYRFKTSVNLIYRCIIDDLINIFYAKSFISESDPEQKALKSEWDILHKEFLQSCLKTLDSYDDLPVVEEFNDEKSKADYIEEMIAADPGLFYSTKKLKSNKDIRNQTCVDKQPDSFISEQKKINKIKYTDPNLSARLNMLFKYYSHFHHFSPSMHGLVLSDVTHEVFRYNRTIELICYMIDEYFKFINISDPINLRNDFEQLCRAVENISKEVE